MTESCPNCDYSMRGLPDRHNCPECGFAYRRNAEVIECGNKIPIFLLVLAGLSFIMFLEKLTGGGVVAFGIAAGTVGLGLGVATNIRKLKRRRRVVLDDEGIVLIGCNARATKFAWRDVERVEYVEMGGNARIITGCGVEHVDVDSEFLGSDRKVRTFVASANGWLARYRAESASDDDSQA